MLALILLGVFATKPTPPPKAPAATEAAEAPAPAAASAEAEASIDAGLGEYRKKRFARAEAEFQKAVEADPKSPAAHYYLGYSIYKTAEKKRPFHPDKARAKAEFERAYELDPEFKPNWKPSQEPERKSKK